MKLGNLSTEDIENNKEIFPMENSKIIEVNIENLNDTGCQIVWTTESLSTINLKYGEDIPPINNKIILEADTYHKIQLDGLTSGTLYYFDIKGETIYYGSFKTTGREPVKINKIEITEASKYSANIKIEFNYEIKGKFKYWKYNDENNILTINIEKFTNSVNVSLNDLEPSSIYYYEISAYDDAAREFNSGKLFFSTKENNSALNKKSVGTFDVKLRDMQGESDTVAVLKRITDGSTNYFSGIAVSQNIIEADQWVIVDLEEPVNIKLVIAFWRKLCYPTNYKIEFSNDCEKWEQIKNNINAANGIEQKADTGDPMLMVFTSGFSKKARYIRLTCLKNNFWAKHKDWNFIQLNELKVYPN
ncbi:MAG TPA: discoidin domain-containing protein [bacterium]|nr:discoidin domain-containing protein [bacterium]